MPYEPKSRNNDTTNLVFLEDDTLCVETMNADYFIATVHFLVWLTFIFHILT